jgi:Xaa-Pro aminopeptidase
MCNFRDNLNSLKGDNTKILGISVDSPFANKVFAEHHNLNFPILSDYNREVIEKYDVVMPNLGKLKDYKAAKRSIFIINNDQKIKYKWVSDNPLIEPNYEEIRKAISITYEGIKNLLIHAKAGMREYQLEAYFDFILKSEGVKHYAFPTICASGKNGTVLHYDKNDDTVTENSLVLLDLGAQYNYYNADISFTFPVSGTFTERQKTFYNIVLKALRETTQLIKPGIPFAKLNEHTKKILAEECIKVGLIMEESELGNYYFHGVSHMLGLDTHDVGKYKDLVLQPGMVLTVEPGLYIEEDGIGIRIEDDVLVTEDGYEVLSKDIFRSVEEIEAFMKE